MSLPYAFYEISMANSGDRDAKVSLRFVFPEDVKTWAVASDCTGEKTIRKGGTATARFVVAWYDHTDPELAHNKNLYASPQPIAKRGLEVFPQLKHNAVRLADGMRRSSLPHWLQNQVANTLSAIVINSMYKRDGRVAFAEGQWTCFGTMDQMWLSRHIICQAAPFYAWRELEYWARTQMKNGQIHHDMNLMDVGSEREKRSALVAWDDTEHRDYRDIQKWVDLNCGFIISVYEAYRTTGDRESFLRLWPNMKRAADRIKKQVELLGNKEYPLTFDGSENSYDAGGNPDPYNANISAVAYRIMAELSAETGESDKAAEYAEACKTVVKSFADRYIRGRDPMTGKHCENVFSGQEL
uniref:GH116 family glycosyl hydrolase n=1 Tax=Prevotella sp. TaxID=59823 RepID=UPI003FF0FB98